MEFRANRGEDSKRYRRTTNIISSAASKHSTNCDAGCKRNETTTRVFKMTIPPTPPTDVTTSQNIRIRYTFIVSLFDFGLQLNLKRTKNNWIYTRLLSIKVKGYAGLCHNTPTIEIPLVIGTHPIVDYLPGTIAERPSERTNTVIPTAPCPSAPSKSGLCDSEQTPLLYRIEGASAYFPQPSAPYLEDGTCHLFW